ncbi:Peptidoglycan-recognition protein LF, partial [Pseudolycoriella hygida]
IVIIGAFVLSYVYISCDRNSFDSASNSYNLTTSSGKESQSSEHEPPFHFVSRSDWLAQPPDADLNDLELPVKRIIIAHTATNNCTNQGTCTFRVRHIQTFHMESQGWDDIGYNFLVGGDGSVYEGRGWNKEGAHTKGFNKRSICIQSGILKADYALYGHRQLIHTESPGTALYDIIKTWPHWSEMYIQ